MNYRWEDKQTDKQTNRHTDRHINTITWPGLRAGPSENPFNEITAKPQTNDLTIHMSWKLSLQTDIFSQLDIYIPKKDLHRMPKITINKNINDECLQLNILMVFNTKATWGGSGVRPVTTILWFLQGWGQLLTILWFLNLGPADYSEIVWVFFINKRNMNL